MLKFNKHKEFQNVVPDYSDVGFRFFQFQDSKGSTIFVEQGFDYPTISLKEITNEIVSGKEEKIHKDVIYSYSLPNKPALFKKVIKQYVPAPIRTGLKNKVLSSELKVMSKNDDNFRELVRVNNGKCWHTYA